MQNVAKLVNNLRLGIKNKAEFVRCWDTRLNRGLLCLFLDIGVVESFKSCPINSFKLFVYLPQVELYSQADVTSRSKVRAKYRTRGIISNYRGCTEIIPLLRLSNKRKLNFKKLVTDIGQKGAGSLTVLHTNRGFVLQKAVFKNKNNGLLVCRISF